MDFHQISRTQLHTAIPFQFHLAWQNVRDLLRNRHLQNCQKRVLFERKINTEKTRGSPTTGFAFPSRVFRLASNWKFTENSEIPFLSCFFHVSPSTLCRFSVKPHRFQLLIHQKTFGDILLPRNDADKTIQCAAKKYALSVVHQFHKPILSQSPRGQKFTFRVAIQNTSGEETTTDCISMPFALISPSCLLNFHHIGVGLCTGYPFQETLLHCDAFQLYPNEIQ